MPAINFPNTPSINDTYTEAGITWIYVGGGVWDVVPTDTFTPEPTNTNTNEITFDVDRIYGRDTARTGNITIDLTGALEGKTQVVRHNDTVEPTYGANTVRGDFDYEANEDNWLFYHLVKKDGTPIILVNKFQPN